MKENVENMLDSIRGLDIPLDSISVVYQDARGIKHVQPVSDIFYVGTLIDPDTGEDLDAVNLIVT